MRIVLSVFVGLCLVALSACRYSTIPLDGKATLSPSQYRTKIKGGWKLKEYYGAYFSDARLSKLLKGFATDGETIAFANEKTGENPLGQRRSLDIQESRVTVSDALTLEGEHELHFDIEAMSENALLLKVTAPSYSKEMSAQLKYARTAHDTHFVSLKRELAKQFATEFDAAFDRWFDAKGEVCRWRTNLKGEFENYELVAKSGLHPHDTVIAVSGTVTDIWAGCDSIRDEIEAAEPKVLASIYSENGFSVLVERFRDRRHARRVLYEFRYED